MGEMTSTPLYRVGIDIGGTFTDIVTVNNETGEIAATKVPSTPDNPALGLVTGVEAIARTVGIKDSESAYQAEDTTDLELTILSQSHIGYTDTFRQNFYWTDYFGFRHSSD